jgi:hypothetical protein
MHVLGMPKKHIKEKLKILSNQCVYIHGKALVPCKALLLWGIISSNGKNMRA